MRLVTHATFRSLRPTLQRLCLCRIDAQLREYRTQNAWGFRDLRTLHRNIVLPRSPHDCSSCDKMMPFGQKLTIRIVRSSRSDCCDQVLRLLSSDVGAQGRAQSGVSFKEVSIGRTRGSGSETNVENV